MKKRCEHETTKKKRKNGNKKTQEKRIENKVEKEKRGSVLKGNCKISSEENHFIFYI